MGAFDNIKNALGLMKKKKNIPQGYSDGEGNVQNSQNKRYQIDEIERTVIQRRDADEEKTTMIWTPKNHK